MNQFVTIFHHVYVIHHTIADRKLVQAHQHTHVIKAPLALVPRQLLLDNKGKIIVPSAKTVIAFKGLHAIPIQISKILVDNHILYVPIAVAPDELVIVPIPIDIELIQFAIEKSHMAVELIQIACVHNPIAVELAQIATV
jgi:hypothetical protein